MQCVPPLDDRRRSEGADGRCRASPLLTADRGAPGRSGGLPPTHSLAQGLSLPLVARLPRLSRRSALAADGQLAVIQPSWRRSAARPLDDGPAPDAPAGANLVRRLACLARRVSDAPGARADDPRLAWPARRAPQDGPDDRRPHGRRRRAKGHRDLARKARRPRRRAEGSRREGEARDGRDGPARGDGERAPGRLRQVDEAGGRHAPGRPLAGRCVWRRMG